MLDDEAVDALRTRVGVFYEGADADAGFAEDLAAALTASPELRLVDESLDVVLDFGEDYGTASLSLARDADPLPGLLEDLVAHFGPKQAAVSPSAGERRRSGGGFMRPTKKRKGGGAS